MSDTAVKPINEVTPQVSGNPKAANALEDAACRDHACPTRASRADARATPWRVCAPWACRARVTNTGAIPTRARSTRPSLRQLRLRRNGAESPLFTARDKLTLVFVDGAFDAAASDDLSLEGIEITTLAQADRADDHWSADLYGTLELAGQTPVKRPFAALNTAVAADGLLIRVTGKPSRPVHVLHRRGSDRADAVWHHVIRVESGAELTMLESGMAGARSKRNARGRSG